MLAVLKAVALTGALFSLSLPMSDEPGHAGRSEARAAGEPSSTAMTWSAATAELFQSIETQRLDEVAAAIDDGADVNARDERGWTPLMLAARVGRPDVVRELLAAGADHHAQAGGVTPLLAALENGNREVVLTLLDEERGSEPTQADLPPAHRAAVAADARPRR